MEEGEGLAQEAYDVVGNNLWQQFAHINEMYSKLCNVCDYLIKTLD